MAQKATVSPTRFPLLTEYSPLLGLGVETTSLPTPSIEMPPLSKAKPDTVGHVPQGSFALVSSEQESIRRSETKTKNTKDYVTSAALN